MNSLRRLQKEIKELNESEKSDLKGQIWIRVKDDSLFDLSGFIRGPPDTPYAGGIFQLELTVPSNYPFSPPIVSFKTKIWHPNISSSSGFICLDILSHNWSASLTLKGILLSIQSLLQEPQPNDPQDAIVARMYKRSKKRFLLTAQYWTSCFAAHQQESVSKDDPSPDTDDQKTPGTDQMSSSTGLTATTDVKFKEFEEKVSQVMSKRPGVSREEAISLLSCAAWKFPQEPTRRSTRARRNVFNF